MVGYTILSFVGWAVLLMNFGVVSRRCPPHPLPPLGGLTTSRISVMVVLGLGWTCICHGVPCWILCNLTYIIDRQILVLFDVSYVDPASYHRGDVIYCVGGSGRVMQYCVFRATSVPISLSVIPQ